MPARVPHTLSEWADLAISFAYWCSLSLLNSLYVYRPVSLPHGGVKGVVFSAPRGPSRDSLDWHVIYCRTWIWSSFVALRATRCSFLIESGGCCARAAVDLDFLLLIGVRGGRAMHWVNFYVIAFPINLRLFAFFAQIRGLVSMCRFLGASEGDAKCVTTDLQHFCLF